MYLKFTLAYEMDNKIFKVKKRDTHTYNTHMLIFIECLWKDALEIKESSGNKNRKAEVKKNVFF